VAEVDIRRGGIDAQFDAERAAEFQFCLEFFKAEDFGGTASEKIDIGHVS
jgi:hypothetical protein